MIPVNPGDLAPVPVDQRSGCLVLYGPKQIGRGSNIKIQYEIVANSESGLCLSLQRSENIDDIRRDFQNFKSKIPLLTDIDPNLCTQVTNGAMING